MRVSKDPDTCFLDGEAKAQREGDGFARNNNDICGVLLLLVCAELLLLPAALEIGAIIIPHFTNGETEAQKVPCLIQGHTAGQCLPYETGHS